MTVLLIKACYFVAENFAPIIVGWMALSVIAAFLFGAFIRAGKR